MTHLPYFLCRTVAALDRREQPIFSPIHALLNRNYNTNIMFKNGVSRFVFLVPFVDNQILIISRGVARIFPEVRKSIYYLRLSFTKKVINTAFWTLFLTDRVTLRRRNHSLRPSTANTG